jgi:hypothetical protein
VQVRRRVSGAGTRVQEGVVHSACTGSSIWYRHRREYLVQVEEGHLVQQQ